MRIPRVSNGNRKIRSVRLEILSPPFFDCEQQNKKHKRKSAFLLICVRDLTSTQPGLYTQIYIIIKKIIYAQT